MHNENDHVSCRCFKLDILCIQNTKKQTFRGKVAGAVLGRWLETVYGIRDF
jgi:hypothetical protein